MKWLAWLLWIFLFFAGLFCIFILMMTVADYRPDPVVSRQVSGNAGPLGPSDSVFTITTWNLGYFGLGKDCDFFYDGGKMTRPPRKEYLKYSGQGLKYLEKNTKSDFYFFQEVDINSARSYYDDQVEKIRDIFPGYESATAINYKVLFVIAPLRRPMGKVKSGLLSLSSFKTGENLRYAFPGGYKWPVRLFQLDRCFLLTRINLPSGKDLVLINTHNEAFDDGSHRRKQLAVLKDLMLAEYAKGNFVVAGGDWNQNPVGFGDVEIGGVEDLEIGGLEDLRSGGVGDLGGWGFSNLDVGRKIDPEIEPDFMPEGWRWVFDPAVPSNRDVIAPYKRGKTRTTIIDFFVVSPNVEVIDVKTQDLGFEWSDHQPVTMKFKPGAH